LAVEAKEFGDSDIDELEADHVAADVSAPVGTGRADR
jgi:hypothetical protein